MKKKTGIYKEQWRFWLVVTLLGFITGGLIARIIYLTVVDRQFLQQQGHARSLRTVEIPAYRGMVTDRNGHPLAISSPVDTVWVNPQQINLQHPKLNQLAQLLKLNPTELKNKLAKNEKKEFLYLKRHIDPALGEKVHELGIEGLYFQKEYRRFYPEGEVASHITGFTNIDEEGQEGIELAYNDWLKGVPGLRQVVKDRMGHIASKQEDIRLARPGHDIQLSLDHHLQYIVWSALKDVVIEHTAQAASMVILDVKTGEVLAMANYPSYNPNQRERNRDDRYRNRAVTDLFEPGSTIKTFSVLNGMLEAKFKPQTKIDTSPGWMVLNRHMVQDHKDLGEVTLVEILQHSSNVGVAKITLATPPNSLWNLLRRVGYGQVTQVKFPGEVAGSLQKPHRWSDFTLSTLSFGYGISSNVLQLAQSYAIIANQGIKYPTTLKKQEAPLLPERVIPAKAANSMLSMLESALSQKGKYNKAAIPGYRIAGKTGTVRMLGPQGYDKHRHVGMFVGIVPVSDPRLVAAIVVTDPKSGKYYGGDVAAPVFAKVMQDALRLMDIAPDEVEEK